MIEYVELAAAKDAPGVRMVTMAMVPSPWSEAAKGVFRIAHIPVLAVRADRGNRDLTTWAGVDNAPAVFYAREPVRTAATAIVGLAARLADDVLPTDVAARAEAIGAIELLAGEQGLGWNGRLAMIHAGLASNGATGFPGPVSAYLAKRYGYSPDAMAGVRERSRAQIAYLATLLAGRDYFGGAKPNALDAYAATFLTPLVALTEADCPQLAPPLRAAFATAAADLGDLATPELLAHRRRMLEQHLGWPIQL